MKTCCVAREVGHPLAAMLVSLLAVGCHQPQGPKAPDLRELTPLEPAKAVRDAKADRLWYDAKLLTVEGR